MHSDVSTSSATQTPRITLWSHQTLKQSTCRRSNYVQITIHQFLTMEGLFISESGKWLQKCGVTGEHVTRYEVTDPRGRTWQRDQFPARYQISRPKGHIGGLLGYKSDMTEVFHIDMARLKTEASWKWYSEVNFISQRDTKVPITGRHNLPLRNALKSV